MKNKIYILLIIFSAISCNKEKRYSKKLIKGEEWEIKSITVDGNRIDQTLSQYGSRWMVSGDDIYKSVSQVVWGVKYTNTNYTSFEWQFQEKGKKWVMNYLQDTTQCDGTKIDDFDYMAFYLSGTYDVVKHRNKEMLFRSKQTNGYPNQTVEIRIGKYDE